MINSLGCLNSEGEPKPTLLILVNINVSYYFFSAAAGLAGSPLVSVILLGSVVEHIFLDVDLGIFLQIFLDLQEDSCCLEGSMAALICSLTSSNGLVPAALLPSA